MPHPADLGLGVRAFLPAQQRLHHAGISGTAFQPPVRRLSRRDFNHRLHLHQNIRAALRRQRGPRAGCRLEAMADGSGSRHRHRHLHRCRGTGGGDLYGHRTDADPHHWCGRPYDHWTRTRRRPRTPPHHGAARLLPHDQTCFGFQLSVDRHFFWRANPRHLVLVYRSGDRAARALGAG